jgi:hypothetical protein
MFNDIHNSIQKLNGSKLFAGLVMLMLNIGSKYVTMKLSKTQEEFLRANLARELLIFAVVWMGTHDIYLSIFMTAAFIILADYIFNEKSKFCIIPHKLRSIRRSIDLNQDDFISDEEIEKAHEILAKAKKKREKEIQLEMLNSMDVNK